MTGPTGRTFTDLPIDGTRGFPQEFPFLFEGRTYHFRLYVNALRETLAGKTAMLDLPAEDAALMVRIEKQGDAGDRTTIFLRKVVPSLEYDAENVSVTFPTQRVAIGNLNGTGDLGTQVTGGMRSRWA